MGAGLGQKDPQFFFVQPIRASDLLCTPPQLSCLPRLTPASPQENGLPSLPLAPGLPVSEN